MSVIIQRPSDRILTIGDMGAVHVYSGKGQDAASGGWWDNSGAISGCWAAYAPKGAADLAASYLDLSGNGNNAGVGVAPTWDAVNGWVFNGSTQYLTTSFVAASDQSQAVLVQYTNLTGSGNYYLVGSRSAGDERFGIYLNTGAPGFADYANGQNLSVQPKLLAGNLAVSGSQGYRDGSAEGAALGAWGGATAISPYIGARNMSGAADLFAPVYIQAVAIYDAVLTAGEVATIKAAMAAL